MSVELPFAPVDALIRENAPDFRVSAEAPKVLARRIQVHGADLAVEAAARADAAGRLTLRADDFEVDNPPTRDELVLPIAPVDRIARLDIDDDIQVGESARLALAAELEAYAESIAAGAALLARHAGRQTVKAEDITTYVQLKT